MTAEPLNPRDYIITRKRKKYKFALFHNNPLCFEIDQWHDQPAPDVIEVGAGTGLFSVAMAGESDKHHLAIDVKADRLQTGARLAADQNLTNIQFVRARVDQLSDVIAPHSVGSIWITFPDPFPRDRSAKHRLTHPSYLERYAQWLRPDGALYFKTDATQLFTWSLEMQVSQGWHIDELSFDLHQSGLKDTYKHMTTYEQRFTAEGLPTLFVRALPPIS